MELKPKFGFEQLLFGMKQKDVIAIYGEPDKQFNDDDQNIIFLYLYSFTLAISIKYERNTSVYIRPPRSIFN